MSLYPNSITENEKLKDLKIDIRKRFKKLKNINNKKLRKIYIYLNNKYTWDDIELFGLKYACNGFNHKGKPMILIKGALFNHSCKPNLSFTFDNNRMIFTTNKNIKIDEELCDTYVNLTDTIEKRHERLLYQYGFECEC